MKVISGANQLCRDTNFFTLLPNATFEQIGHLKFLSY